MYTKCSVSLRYLDDLLFILKDGWQPSFDNLNLPQFTTASLAGKEMSARLKKFTNKRFPKIFEKYPLVLFLLFMSLLLHWSIFRLYLHFHLTSSIIAQRKRRTIAREGVIIKWRLNGQFHHAVTNVLTSQTAVSGVVKKVGNNHPYKHRYLWINLPCAVRKLELILCGPSPHLKSTKKY